MNTRIRRLRRLRRRPTVGLAAVALLVLAACTTIQGLIDTERALDRAGYSDVDVSIDSDEGFDRVEVLLRPPPSSGIDESGVDESAAEAALDEATRIVWTNFPLRFDLLRIELRGELEGYSASYTYGEVAEIFGPRPPSLDEKEVGDDVVKAGIGVAIVLAVGGLIFTAGVVLAIVFGVRASRRRKSVTPPPWPPVRQLTS